MKIEMTCDHQSTLTLGRCRNSVMRAPVLYVPSQTPDEPGHRPMRRFTTLHFCELHKHELQVSDVLSAKIKRDMEIDARRERPADFKPDFEMAWLDFVLCTTPEYRGFLKRLGSDGIARSALGNLRLAG
jgi:hypothetical protein